MKKYLSFLSFIALFFIGMQFSNAQTASNQRPEAIAKQKTYELHKLVTLTGDQQSGIFHVLVDAEQNLGELRKKDATDKLRQSGIKVVNDNIRESFKKILTPEQFATYEASLTKSKE